MGARRVSLAVKVENASGAFVLAVGVFVYTYADDRGRARRSYDGVSRRPNDADDDDRRRSEREREFIIYAPPHALSAVRGVDVSSSSG